MNTSIAKNVHLINLTPSPLHSGRRRSFFEFHESAMLPLPLGLCIFSSCSLECSFPEKLTPWFPLLPTLLHQLNCPDTAVFRKARLHSWPLGWCLELGWQRVPYTDMKLAQNDKCDSLHLNNFVQTRWLMLNTYLFPSGYVEFGHVPGRWCLRAQPSAEALGTGSLMSLPERQPFTCVVALVVGGNKGVLADSTGKGALEV